MRNGSSEEEGEGGGVKGEEEGGSILYAEQEEDSEVSFHSAWRGSSLMGAATAPEQDLDHWTGQLRGGEREVSDARVNALAWFCLMLASMTCVGCVCVCRGGLLLRRTSPGQQTALLLRIMTRHHHA